MELLKSNVDSLGVIVLGFALTWGLGTMANFVRWLVRFIAGSNSDGPET